MKGEFKNTIFFYKLDAYLYPSGGRLFIPPQDDRIHRILENISILQVFLLHRKGQKESVNLLILSNFL